MLSFVNKDLSKYLRTLYFSYTTTKPSLNETYHD